MVEEDISFVGFVEKIYAKIGASRDTFDISLSYLLYLIEKTSPIFIRIDEDVEIFFEERNERICKIPLKVVLIPKGEIVNKDNDDDSDDAEDDTRDLSLHDGGGGFHDTWFDIDYLVTNQNEVGTSRTKLPLYRIVEPVGIEFGYGRGRQVAKNASQPEEDAT